MIAKSDWEEAARDVAIEEAMDFEEVPTDDEVIAFARGQLTEPRATQVRSYLASVPELLDALTAPFPSADAPPVLTELQREQDWARLKARLQPRSSSMTMNVIAVAASVAAIGLGVLLLESYQDVRHLEEQLRRPRINFDNRLLWPDGKRSGSDSEKPVVLSQSGDFLLVPVLINEIRYDDYRIEILEVREGASRVVYSVSGVVRRSDDTLPLWVPRTFLRAGVYRVVVSGLTAGQAKPLATYTIRMPRRTDD